VWGNTEGSFWEHGLCLNRPMRTFPRLASCLLMLCVPVVARGFWGKKTDEERLKEKLESVKVQLYRAAKAAVTKTAGSEEAGVVKERLLGVAGKPTRTSVKEMAALGKARLAELSKREVLPASVSDDLKHLEKSCGDKEASSQHKVVDKVRLGRVVVRGAWAHLKRSGLLEVLGNQEWVKAVGDFVTAVGEGIGKVPGGLQVSFGGAGWD
jgi:hypothetical protein